MKLCEALHGVGAGVFVIVAFVEKKFLARPAVNIRQIALGYYISFGDISTEFRLVCKLDKKNKGMHNRYAWRYFSKRT